ncbi:AAA family ATPase [Curtobacterium flaccumfaciens]|uniref:AAA family ATPase n=1 Tax=Curtobacterium flaccumfaciens TaxID=2035 RepID=UPI003EC0DF85
MHVFYGHGSSVEIRPDQWGSYAWADLHNKRDRQDVRDAFEVDPLRVVAPGRRWPDFREVSGKEARHLRAEITGAYENRRQIFDPTDEPATRPMIPGIWNHGRISALSGPKGVGKTTFVCQLAASLIIQRRRFLDLFEPAELTEEERQRDVWLINSETHPGAVHEELLRAGLAFGYRDGVPCYYDPAYDDWQLQGVLIVDHLSTHNGGARAFDLTDDAVRQRWENDLIGLSERRLPPHTVIADGVTAMLGSNTSGYGAWTSGFKRLLQGAGIPNGLGVLHSPMSAVGPGRAPTPMNGVESVGEWDGVWYFAAGAFPVFPWTTREFYTAPRVGDPVVLSHKVSMDDEGMLRLLPRATKPARDPGTSTSTMPDLGEDESWERDVLDRLRDAGKTGLSGTDLTGRGREGKLRREARDRLVESGLIVSVPDGRGTRWLLYEFR